MTNISSNLRLLVALSALALVSGCETETATSAVVDNSYPPFGDGGDPATQVVVYRAWYATALFKGALAPGDTSEAERVVPATNYAYALLAVGWDPSSAEPPARFVVVRSADKLAVSRGDTLQIAVSSIAFVGDCAAGRPLSQDDADFVTQRIFPGEFANVTYDAASCVLTAKPAAAPALDGGPADGDTSG
jgi:hypothetical protein